MDAGQSIQKRTSLPPSKALDQVVQRLTAMGGQVTSRTESSVTGAVTSTQNPNILVAILLLLFCVVPGIVYLVVARKTITAPFVVQVSPDGDGSTLTYTGQGSGFLVAQQAVNALP